MNPTDTMQVPAPSKGAILKAAAIALFVALLLLFTVVLPAEYAYDPLGTGKALGLTVISEAGASGTTPEAAAPVVKGAYTAESKIFKYDSQDFLLPPGDGMEMKYHMQKGATMVYAWKADGVLEFEFHGEPDVEPSKGYYESYELDKTGKDASYGSFVAPSTGIHGWYFKNNSDKDIKFHLNVAGFIDGAKMYAGGPGEDVPVEDAK
jgi:hypothetical protein